jgi:hypothetical protein
MSLREELEMPAEEAVQKAYDEAGRFEFMGRRLEPWTVRRHSVSLQLRSRLMRGMEDENKSISTFLADGFYPHVIHDLVVVLYLCHLDKTEVVKLEQLSETEAMAQAYDWAESIPLSYGSAAFFEGVKVLAKILHGMHVSWFQIAKSEAAEPEKKSLNGDIEVPGSSKQFSGQSAPAGSTLIT